MKKAFKAAAAVLLCLVMLSGSLSAAAAAVDLNSAAAYSSIDNYLASSSLPVSSAPSGAVNFKILVAKAINAMSNLLLNKGLLNIISMGIPMTGDVINYRTFDLDSYGNFYEGTGSFADSAAVGNCWNLGYSEKSIIPADFGTAAAARKYARGSYVPWWYSTEVYDDDDLRVRTIVMSDGSANGKVAFSVIDCIGLSNTDVRMIRAAVEDYAAANNIVSINVSATHTHSGIDSQGVWTAPLSVMGNNFLSAITLGLVKSDNGVEDDFLDTVINQTAASIKEATESMTSGELYYSSVDLSEYNHDRTPPKCCDGEYYVLTFRPFDSTAKPTIIASYGCHPESSSYDWVLKDENDMITGIDTKLSGDFVYYAEKVCNAGGYNFIFIQGNVGTNTSSRGNSNDGIDGLSSHDGAMRYGYELGYIAMGISMSREERIALNTRCGDLLGVAEYGGGEGYTPWYDNLETAEAELVEPYLNIAHRQIIVEAENSMTKILTKTGLADNALLYDFLTGKYYSVTEIGYMEVGDSLKVFLCSGELFSELLMDSESLGDFEYPALRDLYGENLIVFDLMNDAAGYIEPDNYYTIAGLQYDVESDSLESDTWCLLVSMGKNTASKLMGEFISLVDSVK